MRHLNQKLTKKINFRSWRHGRDVLKKKWKMKKFYQTSIKSKPFELLRWFIQQMKALEKLVTKLSPVFESNCLVSRYERKKFQLTLHEAILVGVPWRPQASLFLKELSQKFLLRHTCFTCRTDLFWTTNSKIFSIVLFWDGLV